MHVFFPLYWFSSIPEVFRWWLALMILGALSFPTMFILFNRFKDRGYPLSKIFGAFFVAYINWASTWISSRLNIPIFQNNFISIGLGVILLAFVSFLIFRKKRTQISDFIRKKKRYIILVEAIFLLVFLFFIRVRSFVPEAQFDPMKSGAEKFLNFQVINSIMKSTTFPPDDGWMSGKALAWNFDEIKKKISNPDGSFKDEVSRKEHQRRFYINYYYFGHLTMATLGKLSFYPAEYVFNLGLATLLAFTCMGAFCLGFNLGGSVLLAIFAMLAIAFFGNLDATIQYFQKIAEGVRGDDAFWGVDFWRSSRMFEGTITEFPFFSIILGDFHAHNLNIPNFLFLCALLVNLAFRQPDWKIDFEEKILWRNIIRRYGFLFCMIGVFWGACYLTNSWDVINCAMLIGFFIFYFYLSDIGGKKGIQLFIKMCMTCFGVGVIALLTLLFFQIYFEKPIDTEGFPFKWLPANLRTPWQLYLAHHFFFLVPILIYFAIVLKNTLKTLSDKSRLTLLSFFIGLIIILLNWLGYLMPSVAFTLMVFSIIILFKKKPHSMKITGKDTGGAIKTEPAISAHDCVTTNIAMIFIAVSFFVSFACDVWYLDDRYAGDLERYNTVFKFYYPIWSLLALASVIAFRYFFLWSAGKMGGIKIKRFLVYALLIVIALLGLHYPLASTIVRTSIFERTPEGKLVFKPIRGEGVDRFGKVNPPRTINAIAYIRELDKFKDDFDAIMYIKKNIKGRPVILEAAPDAGSGAYSPVSRISTCTGLRSIMGWSHHEAQHRGGRAYAEIGPREQDVKSAYTTTDWNAAKSILDKYDVRYVFVGAIERERYSPEQLSKFEQNLKEVFRSNTSVLYEYKK